jgi:hypothetical protein
VQQQVRCFSAAKLFAVAAPWEHESFRKGMLVV